MQIDQFKSIVSTFSDPGQELLYQHNRMVVSVNGDLIDVSITSDAGDIYVNENTAKIPASKWIINRLARLDLLAQRLREQVPETKAFVCPPGSVTSTGASSDRQVDDVITHLTTELNNRSRLDTMVMYLTSDAGEGKTSLVNELSRCQAVRFQEGHSDWLLVPIALGGRHFLRFDDITVGALQNKFRFPFLYYKSFLELVKMGVLIPAFDGFEEMFVENSSGEALSAMSILLSSFQSKGAVVISARKAYFEFENLGLTQKFFDTIKEHSVVFERTKLTRWQRSQFIRYAKARRFSEAERLYASVSEILGPGHPILTRPVLIKRLIDMALNSHSIDGMVKAVLDRGTHYFDVIVREIVEREVSDKWIDRSGLDGVGTPLLTCEDHLELLSDIAIEMWLSRVDYVKSDVLEFITDYFCDVKKINISTAAQVRKRIPGHALLVASPNANGAVEFDHDEYKTYFLGSGIARKCKTLNEREKNDVLGIFNRGLLPVHAVSEAVRLLGNTFKDDRSGRSLCEFILSVSSRDSRSSFTQQNCSNLLIRFVSQNRISGVKIRNLAFDQGSLDAKELCGLEFESCYFSVSKIDSSTIKDCFFCDCRFSQLNFKSGAVIDNVRFERCQVDSLILSDGHEYWEPGHIESKLKGLGFKIQDSSSAAAMANVELPTDKELVNIEKLVRYFMRSTHIGEKVMLIKLGDAATEFISETLPILTRQGLLEEIDNRGDYTQRRFKLGLPLAIINSALQRCHGSFEIFLAELSTRGPAK